MPFGVDEAGKGPAIGPMVAAAVWADDPARLPEGIADSKELTPAKRESLAETMRAGDAICVGVGVIEPARIDAPETDMNGLAVTAHARAIEDALGETDVASETDGDLQGVCDACDTDADRFARRVTDDCSLPVSVDASHGADADDPLVGAASVIAKVDRDARVERLAARYAERGYDDLGSGYPSDPKTRSFLESYVADHGELPDGARRSWGTCRDVLAEAAQTGLGEFASE
ncbi:ribonuclease HII [Halovivax gelatinilyticus]|uniref:ribonuclease HII n=1 Tax=Halovivax gelatinilyticus TaxID=2961597 RepID=UPI0020CA93D2|nr:ribonuclease HII [Halovivax gelatinilyticus]